MSVNETEWYLYIIKTKKGPLYTGIATDIERRFQEHVAMFEGQPNAKGAKYFRFNQPLAVVYQETFENRSLASKRESAIKKMTKQQKLKLIESLS